jgi:ferrous-iron efflux pump FieF
MRDATLNLSAGIASVAVALVLVLLKLWTFAVTGSLAVAASLIDSGLDLLVSIGALLAIRYAARPADADHTFGHSSAEDLAALGQALFVTISACAVGGGAVWRLAGGSANPVEAPLGIAAMLVAIALTAVLVLWQRHVARRTGSRVVKADSLHYLADLLPALGAIVALGASAVFGVQSLDAVVAIVAALVLLVGAARIFRGAWDALMDRSADPAVIARIDALVAAWPGVRGHHDLKTRTAGAKVFVQVHIELDGEQTLHEAHAIGAALRRAIVAAVPSAEVIIHKDPVRRALAPSGHPPHDGPAGPQG